MTDSPTTPFLEIASQLGEDIARAKVETVGDLMEYLEVTDRQGFVAVTIALGNTAIAMLTEKGPDGLNMSVIHAMVLGSRLGKAGLL